MTFVTYVLLVLVLLIGFVPAWLLRHASNRRAQDYLVAAGRTRLPVVRNASIAYALRMAAFAPLFAWGASGDLWPAVTASICLGLGTWLVYVVRRPLLEFLDEALAGEGSVTVHEFVARAHGGDPRVRFVAAVLSLCALFGLLAGEILVACAFLAPMLKASPVSAALLVLAATLSIAATAALSGHSGIMQSAQLQLGMLYFGLFGATALVLYLHMSARTPLPPQAVLAIVFVAIFSVIVLWYRRSRYVDTDTIRHDSGEGRPGGLRAARALSRLGKILNGALSALLVLIVVLAVLDLTAADVSALARAAAPAGETRIPGGAMLALILLPLFYPLVDQTNWLRLAATRKDAGVDPIDHDAALRGAFAIYAVETTLIGLLVCAFGAITGVALMPPGATDVPDVVAARLTSADNAVAAIASVLLAVSILAAALSTTSALFAAGLCTLSYDVLRRLRPVATAHETAASEARARRRTRVAGLVGLAFALAVAIASVSMSHPIGFTTGALPALLSALCCAQLAFVPLVLGPIFGRAHGSRGAVRPNWALAVLAVGAGSGLVAIAAYLATGVDAWLWPAVPVCLGSGFVLFAIGRTASAGMR